MKRYNALYEVKLEVFANEFDGVVVTRSYFELGTVVEAMCPELARNRAIDRAIDDGYRVRSAVFVEEILNPQTLPLGS